MAVRMNAGLHQTERSYRPRRLDRSTLPAPVQYLRDNGLLTCKPRGEWAPIKCPTHKAGNEAHASMNVSLVDGHYRCHVCGEKGSDVIALHRARTGLGFVAAVEDLGGRFE